jgi:hypothetical protein
MAHFSPDMITYTDATLGWFIDGFWRGIPDVGDIRIGVLLTGLT